MAQVLERIKTFFVMMTQNDNEMTISGDKNIEEEVKAIKAQESGAIEKLENAINKVNIPLEEKGIVDKAKVDEKLAQKDAQKQVKEKASKEKQIGE
jgi:hypothetical protein